MKTHQKTKNTPTRKASRRPSSTSQVVALAHATRPVLRHFRLVEYKHTGKLIHHQHTSYLALIGLLLVVGFFLYASASFARAQQITSDGSVSIGATVPGPAPTVGATILSPVDGTNLTNQSTVEVTGTCAPGTFVVVQDNSELVGSTVCTDAGIFVLQIQLQTGMNVLSALNYDNLNQPGPNTPLVRVNVTTSGEQPSLPVGLPILLPANPSIVVGLNSKVTSCDDRQVQTLPIGGVSRVAVVCIPRFVAADTQQTLSIMVWGGSPPYALDIDWGNGAENTLLSLTAQGTRTVNFSYSQAGVYTITLRLKDKDGKPALVQTAVQVSGAAITPLGVLADDILHTSWFKTPVPLYLLAVAITLGFWGGDIFDRNFGARKNRSRSRKAA